MTNKLFISSSMTAVELRKNKLWVRDFSVVHIPAHENQVWEWRCFHPKVFKIVNHLLQSLQHKIRPPVCFKCFRGVGVCFPASEWTSGAGTDPHARCWLTGRERPWPPAPAGLLCCSPRTAAGLLPAGPHRPPPLYFSKNRYSAAGYCCKSGLTHSASQVVRQILICSSVRGLVTSPGDGTLWEKRNSLANC